MSLPVVWIMIRWCVSANLIEQLSNSGVIVFVVSHDFEFIVRTCTEVVQLDDHGAIQNHRLSSETLKALSKKIFYVMVVRTMEIHASGEDYLEAILVLHKKTGMVRSVDVARHMECIEAQCVSCGGYTKRAASYSLM